MKFTLFFIFVFVIGFLSKPEALAFENPVYETSVIDPFVYIGARIGMRSMAPAYDASAKMKEKNAQGKFLNFELVKLSMVINHVALKVEGLTTLKANQDRTHRKHVMFYYGVGGNIGRLLHEELFLTRIQQFLGPNTDISLIDYPGYGVSEGEANELTIIASAKQALSYFNRTYNLQGQSLLLGHSLGSAVALQVAVSQPDNYKGFVLLNPFYEFGDSAGIALWLTKDRYKSYQFAPKILKPGYVTGGIKDNVVKENSSRRLAAEFKKGIAAYWANPYDHVVPILEKGDVKAFDEVWTKIMPFINSLP